MFSLILPFHSDYDRLAASLKRLDAEGENYKIREVLLCHNGPPMSQEQRDSVQKLLIPSARLLHTDRPGLGAGYKLGIQNAKQPYCVLSASDIPFGFSDIESFLKSSQMPQMALGSKAHKDSQITGYGISRRIFSQSFWLLRALFLGFQTPRDSQGTILVQRELALQLLPFCHYDDYFFTVEFITLAQQQSVEVVELSVTLENHGESSSVSPLRDGWKMIRHLTEFSTRIKREK